MNHVSWMGWGIVGGLGLLQFFLLGAAWIGRKKLNAVEHFLKDLHEKNLMQEKMCTEVIQKNTEFQEAIKQEIAELKHRYIEFQNQQTLGFEEFKQVIKQQMFIHEALLLNEEGKWCLSHEGEKKYFTPGKIEKVTSDNSREESVFSYEADRIICTVTQDGNLKSELVYSLAGAPKSGRIYMNGKIVKEFSYNDIGQVSTIENSQVQ